MQQNIERKIIIGLISSTPYFRAVRKTLQVELFQSGVGKTLAGWCIEFFDVHRQAPLGHIEEIYFEKVRKGAVSTEIAEEIEEDILPELSEEYVQEGVEVEPLVRYTEKYFRELKLQALKSELEVHLDKGDLDDAEALIKEHRTATVVQDELILNSTGIGAAVNLALTQTYEPLITYSGALGRFWNSQLVRGGMVGFLAPEKRGKTALLLEMAHRGARQQRKVAFFQAGDMTRKQWLRRSVISVTGKTDKENHVGMQYCPVKDCVKNQLNLCDKRVRESTYGIFEDRGWDEKRLKEEISMPLLIEAFEADTEYQPCYNCSEYLKNSWGVPWIKQVDMKLLGVKEAEKAMENWFVKKNRDIRLSTHINGSLSVTGIREVLDAWYMADGWVPDIVLVDYADLLIPTQKTDFRHQQNQIWKDLRGLNQELDCLLITATQADADSYTRDTLTLSNFSEDKRKYGHVTAMYGLNWDKYGREKKIGLLRINELVLREDEFDTTRCVTVLQSLRQSRAVIGSYF